MEFARVCGGGKGERERGARKKRSRSNVDAQVRIPGDPEREAFAVRSRLGVPITEAVVKDLLDIQAKTGVPLTVPEPL